MNFTIYGIIASTFLYPSSFIHFTPKSETFHISSSRFHNFFSPVFYINSEIKKQSFSFYDQHFLNAKAVKVCCRENKINHCTKTKDSKLNHQDLNTICIDFIKCRFIKCTSKENGGAVDVSFGNTTFIYCVFEHCNSQFGGTIYSSRSKLFVVNYTTIYDSSAERFGTMYCDSKRREFSTNISNTNITKSVGTLYIAGIRVETTRPNFQYLKIINTYSPSFGAIWDWSTKPTTAIYYKCDFVNNSSETPGSAITLYHWLHQSQILHCSFSSGKGPDPYYVYLYSSECEVLIENCKFDQPKNVSVGSRYVGNNITFTDNIFS
ncbi:hypothetical protein TRFO_35522 [Tritrichomonas foetus]|uniref:Right handed beta helix domain-containing protein n=1 Tax=Tritrichomonas foetus TaxID=1144522 RepID=A0A1J4JG34_9EUKA|nr:hypothetical protein TRFO_35522 [Tritrichomonas foetus]|eukprot:OHS98104.1 hypothetical protein TRFO_35522 [Tritrichomonas foetus]